MFYKDYGLIYTCSNILVSRINNIPIQRLTRHFIINDVNDLIYISKIIQKIYDKLLQQLDSPTIKLVPIADNLFKHMGENIRIISNAIFLLLKRPFSTNPLNFNLFKDDAVFWYTKLHNMLKNRFISIFIYDPLYISNILIDYLPLILIASNTIDKSIYTRSCPMNILCSSYAVDFSDFYIIIGIWSSGVEIMQILSAINLDGYSFATISNPIFHINTYTKTYCSMTTDYNILLSMSKYNQHKEFDNVVIEFFSSYYLSIAKNLVTKFTYLWFPIPSSKILIHIINSLSGIKTNSLTIISPINNFAERGSTTSDRIWISTLGYITRASYTTSVISG